MSEKSFLDHFCTAHDLTNTYIYLTIWVEWSDWTPHGMRCPKQNIGHGGVPEMKFQNKKS